MGRDGQHYLMAGVMIALAGAKGSAAAPPSVSMTADSGFAGYIRPGSDFAISSGFSGGTLSATLLPGGDTDVVIAGGVILAGDRTAELSGLTSLRINGTPNTITAVGLDGDGNTEVSVPTASFTGGLTYTLQLT